MLLGLYTDPHFSQSSSIIVGRKGSFNGRLQNLIESFEWMNKVFSDKGVDKIVCLGDMTDKPILTAEEITAIGQCNTENHYFIVGNHCRSDKSGKMNSLSLLNNVVSEPQFITDEVYILPYTSDEVELPDAKIVLSHNDIKGFDFGGGHVSKDGLELDKILEHTQLYINGHLHNGGWVVPNRILNLGTLSGINFSSCGGQWDSSIAIVNTDTLEVELIENPIAYKFRKVSFDALHKLKAYLDNLDGVNFVLQVKTPIRISNEARQLINQCDKVVASRILSYDDREKEIKEDIKEVKLSTTDDIYNKLRTFINEKGTTCSKRILSKLIDAMEKEGVSE